MYVDLIERVTNMKRMKSCQCRRTVTEHGSKTTFNYFECYSVIK